MRLSHVVLLAFCGAVFSACSSASRSSATEAAPELSSKDPLTATMLMQQGQTLVAEGKVPEGLERYRAAIKLQPQNPTAHNLIGIALLQLHQPAKAVESFNSALKLAPMYSDARSNRGAAYVQLGQFAMAESDFLAVLADTTHAARAGVYFNLGSLYAGRGNLSAAEENLRKATIGSAPVDAFVLLAQVEERLAKPAAAELAFREATKRAPERADVALGLARVLESEGRAEEARDWYRKVIALAPESTEANQARLRLGR
jgi:type IV pilus assembly protein PilF